CVSATVRSWSARSARSITLRRRAVTDDAVAFTIRRIRTAAPYHAGRGHRARPPASRDRAVSRVSPARGVAGGGGGRSAQAVPGTALLGPTGAVVRRPAGAGVRDRARPGRPRGQPDEPHVHRRPLG